MKAERSFKYVLYYSKLNLIVYFNNNSFVLFQGEKGESGANVRLEIKVNIYEIDPVTSEFLVFLLS